MSSPNIVHVDENWRQRLKNEQQSAATWRDNWGFLEHAQSSAGSQLANSSHSSSLMGQLYRQQHSTYPMMKQIYDEGEKQAKQTASQPNSNNSTISGIASVPSPSSSSSSSTCGSCSGSSSAPLVPSRTSRLYYASTSPKHMHLTQQLARAMLAHPEQDVGRMAHTEGLNPHDKYRAPMLNSHNYGWKVEESNLEFFFNRKHHTRSFNYNELDGWGGLKSE